jgi:hypothetical protein
MRNTFLVILNLILMSCDRSVPLLINNDVVYPLNSSCGIIEFRASTFSSAITVYQNVESGSFIFNLDSLNIFISPQEAISIKAIHFYDKKGEAIKQKVVNISAGDRINLHVELDKTINGQDGTLLITPNSYITCRGQRLITDTLKIIY